MTPQIRIHSPCDLVSYISGSQLLKNEYPFFYVKNAIVILHINKTFICKIPKRKPIRGDERKKGKLLSLILPLSIGICLYYTALVVDIKPLLDPEQYFSCTYCIFLPNYLLSVSTLSILTGITLVQCFPNF